MQTTSDRELLHNAAVAKDMGHLATISGAEMKRRLGISAEKKVARYGWTTQGQPGELCYIEKTALHVDPTYQRDESPAEIARIRREFNWLSFGCLTVVRRPDGKLMVVEGQQRLAAAMGRSDISTLPCSLFVATNIKEEARAFLDANLNRKPISSVDTFRSKLITEDPVSLRCQALLDASGYRVSRSSGGHCIACISVMQKLSRLDHDTLTQIWPVVVELSSGAPIHERLLDSLFYLQRNATPAITERAFRAKLLRIGRAGLLDWCAKAAAYHARGGAKIWASGIFDALNHGARANTLLWRS